MVSCEPADLSCASKRSCHRFMASSQPFRSFWKNGAGPLGVGPTCILRLRAFDTPRCPMMHDRRARSTFLHKKRVASFQRPAGTPAATGTRTGSGRSATFNTPLARLEFLGKGPGNTFLHKKGFPGGLLSAPVFRSFFFLRALR